MAGRARFPMPLLYPFRGTPLFLVLATALVDGLLFTSIIAAVILVLVIAVLSIWFARYAFAAFDRTVEGFADPPALTYETIEPFTDLRPLQLAVLWGLGLFAVALGGDVGGAGARYMIIALLVALAPAAVMVLALKHNMVAALNPVLLVQFIRLLGSTYLAALLASLGTIGLAMLAWRAELGAFPALAVSLYLALVLMHLLGRAAYRERAVLGLRPANAPEERAAQETEQTQRQWRRALASAYDQRRQPRLAAGAINACIGEHGDGLDVHRWFHRELMQWNDRRVALAHAQTFIPRLLAAGRRAEAAHVLAACREAEPGFSIDDADTARALGQVDPAEDGP